MQLPVEFNYNSIEWGLISKALSTELETCVGKLCNLGCSQTTTDQLRGRIGLIKDILAGAEAAARERLR